MIYGIPALASSYNGLKFPSQVHKTQTIDQIQTIYNFRYAVLKSISICTQPKLTSVSKYSDYIKGDNVINDIQVNSCYTISWEVLLLMTLDCGLLVSISHQLVLTLVFWWLVCSRSWRVGPCTTLVWMRPGTHVAMFPEHNAQLHTHIGNHLHTAPQWQLVFSLLCSTRASL